MASEKLSARQLSVAVMAGGLSLTASAAGRMDWRWTLLATALALPLGWLLLRRVGGRPLYQGMAGHVLAVLFCTWSVVLIATVLRRAAQRLQLSSGDRDSTLWLLLLLALPLLWMGWGKAAAFFRAVEIFWLAMVVVLAGIFVLGVIRIDWRYLWEPTGTWWESMIAMGGVLSTGLFVLPHIDKIEAQPGDSGKGLGWSGGLGVVSAALSALIAGLLSPAVAVQLREPFFLMTGLLGNSARLEGLISALWLIPDLTLAGLLSWVWNRRHWPAAAVILAVILALTGITDQIPALILSCVSLGLVAITFILPKESGK